jgi:hypothetical protein
MVYGLNIVTANEFLYGAEALDGNIAAIRSIDQEPDGGVDYNSAYGGRRCHTKQFPTQMRWEGPKGSIAGDFNPQNFVNISKRAKAFIEEWEPDVHQFVPFDLVDQQGNLIEKRYFWVVCNRIDSIDREHTTFILRKGKMWRPIRDIAEDEPELLPENVDPNGESKFVFNLSQIGSAHAWHDKHMDLGNIWLSKEFGDAIKTSDLTGVRLSETGLEAL